MMPLLIPGMPVKNITHFLTCTALISDHYKYCKCKHVIQELQLSCGRCDELRNVRADVYLIRIDGYRSELDYYH